MHSLLTAPISEIFSSIQGEGMRCGERHIFVRFSGCNLQCTYCDTPENQNPTYGTSYSVDAVCAAIQALPFPYALHSMVSLTGGEPLLYHAFIKALAPRLHAMGLRVYLETNATLPDAFKDIADDVDVVAADYKLAQYVGKDMWDAHQKFFALLTESGKEHFIKIIFGDDVTVDTMHDVCKKLTQCTMQCAVVLQPMTHHAHRVTRSTIDAFQQIALQYFHTHTHPVRVIPQMHKMIHVR